MRMSAITNPVEQVMTTTVPNQDLEIWIGYTKHGRNYLEKQTKAPNTEQQIIHLIEFYKLCFSTMERAMLRWLWCQRPVIQVCEITAVSPCHKTQRILLYTDSI